MKTLTEWNHRHLDRIGTLEWTTPMGQTSITEPAVKILGPPHLADAVLRATLDHDMGPPPPEHDDHVPDELWAELNALMDAEIAADRANRTGIFSR